MSHQLQSGHGLFAAILGAILGVSSLLAVSTTWAAGAAPAAPQAAGEEKQPVQVLITNVSVWDGTSDKAVQGMDVLVQGNLIRQIGRDLEVDYLVTR